MKVFTCTTFEGKFPVPVAAVIVAETQQQAADMLNEWQRKEGRDADVELQEMIEMQTDAPMVVMLSNGELLSHERSTNKASQATDVQAACQSWACIESHSTCCQTQGG